MRIPARLAPGKRTKNGRELLYSLNAAALREVDAWLRRYELFRGRQLESFKIHVVKQA